MDEGEAMQVAAAVLGLDIPAACEPGVAQNLHLLQTHFRIVEAWLAQDRIDEGQA